MHEPFNPHSAWSREPSGPQSAGPSVDELTRIFNTALVSTRADALRDFSAELFALVDSPAFHAILGAVRQLARAQGLGEREAAEAVIQAFRKVDRIWEAYILQEGVDRLRSQAPISS
jgi:hypothetical protein